MNPEAQQGETYVGYVRHLLEEERRRRDTIDERAASVVTSSSATAVLVSTAVGLAAGFELRVDALTVTAVAVALLAFLVAVLMAVLASRLEPYAVPDTRTLELFLTQRWTDTETTARNNTAWLDLDTVGSLRRGNARKSWALAWALRIQLVAVAAVVLAVAVELGGGFV